MLPSFQPVVRDDAPSEAWLLCAACGPLSEAQAREVGFSLRNEPGLLYEHRRYEVAEVVAFPMLRRWVEASPRVQEAVSRLAGVRLRLNGGGKKRLPPLSHEELAGCARGALLCGKQRVFQSCYKKYIATRPYEWHPDAEHFLFWDRVLGAGWHGSDAVPAGAAREEIVLLSASCFAFTAQPESSARGQGACGAPEGEELLELAAALREADAAALHRLAASGTPAAVAAGELLAGKWVSAQQHFEEAFGRAAENRYALEQQHALPLLVYALLNCFFAGGSRRSLQAWLGYARSMVQHIYSWYMEEEQGEMMRFLDNLEVVDSLVNRHATVALNLRVKGALSHLPYALAYAALPNYVHRQVSACELVDALESLSRSGLHLLAAWGAMGMKHAAALAPEQRRSMEALSDSMLPLPPTACGIPSTQQALAAVRDVLAKHCPPGSLSQCAPDEETPCLGITRTVRGMLIDLNDWEALPGTPSAPLLRCMQTYAGQGHLVLEGATPAELTRLCVELQGLAEIEGGLTLPGDECEEPCPRVVLLLARQPAGGFRAALRLQLCPQAYPLLIPACGLRDVVLEREGGEMVPLRRHFGAEARLMRQTLSQLRRGGLSCVRELEAGVVALSRVDELTALVQQCRKQGLDICWERGCEYHVHQPQGGLRFHTGRAENGWLELGADLPVDENRVLELGLLLEAYERREGNTLPLAEGECVVLNPTLERQLTLLQLVWQEKRGKRGVCTAALPLLQQTGNAGSTAEADENTLALPQGLKASLRTYQLDGYRWLATRADMGVGALLADDMGLGKTVQTLALLLHAAEQNGAEPSLVIAPVSLLGNWKEEAARFTPSLQVITYDAKNPGCLAGLGGSSLVLASYGQLTAGVHELCAHSWNVLVLDEAQTIKNPDTHRAKAACALRARARFCLTGTPIENRLLDLWSQMRFLNPGLFGSQANFQKRFGRAGEEAHSQLRQVLAPLVLRRTKAEVLRQLPPLTENIEWVEFSREERALYESLRRSALEKLGGQREQDGGISLLAELTRLRRACCHGKLALAEFKGHSTKLIAMAERVEQLRASGRRVLIFSQFTDVLDLAQEELNEREITCLRLDGSTPAQQRSAIVKRFQQGEAEAFLISLKAGGAGLNLTAADYVILLDPWWNPAVEAQAAGRSHRMGQGQPVTLCRFMVRGTVEERISDMHRDKKELAESVLNGTGEGMSLANLRALLGV